MVIFPWIVTVVVLAILTFLVITAPQAAGRRATRGRMRVRRPTMRLVVMLALFELVLLLVWAIYARSAWG